MVTLVRPRGPTVSGFWHWAVVTSSNVTRSCLPARWRRVRLGASAGGRPAPERATTRAMSAWRTEGHRRWATGDTALSSQLLALSATSIEIDKDATPAWPMFILFIAPLARLPQGRYAEVGAAVVAGVARQEGGEPMRARYPDREGYVERDGVKTFYEVFGDGTPTILLLPPWSILHSRLWKMQVPYLARHYRVVTFDGRGNGRSDRPAGAPPYVAAECCGRRVGSHGRDRDRAGRGRVAVSGCGLLIAPERRRARPRGGPGVPLPHDTAVAVRPGAAALHRALRAGAR